MKRPPLSFFVVPLIFALALVTGCGGGDQEPKDPFAVLNGAFAEPVAARGGPGAEVEVASLGYQDAILRSRTLTVDPSTYTSISEAIASPQEGLQEVVADIAYEGREEVDGVRTDHVSGKLDIEKLVSSLEKAVSEGMAGGSESEGIPGLGDLDRLEQSLVDGRFDLYADADTGTFEKLALTLSLDDQENALPPSRIRFSLTESDPQQGEG